MNKIHNPTILILDSGVGGLSIYDKVRQKLPNAHFIYVFDNKEFPYGEKQEKFIISRIKTILNAIWRLHKIDMIIIACNTASIISLSSLRQYFSCPIVGVVPAIKPAVKITRNKIIGLLATNATIQHKYTHDMIHKFAGDCKILKLGTTELVDMAEAKLHGKIVQISVLRKILHPWLTKVEAPDTIVLGCTHFPLMISELQSIFPEKTNFIDSGLAIANRVAWLFDYNIHASNLKVEHGDNRAYCLETTHNTLKLIPMLMSYCITSLTKLLI